jgi:hypothetical protein
MKSIKDNSTFLQFTCEHEKNLAINKSDYLQIQLQQIKQSFENVDVLEFNRYTSRFNIDQGRGKIGRYDLSNCQIRLYQSAPNWALVVVFPNFKTDLNPACAGNLFPCTTSGWGFFGGYRYLSDEGKKFHRCTTNENSTSQLWFGI